MKKITKSIIVLGIAAISAMTLVMLRILLKRVLRLLTMFRHLVIGTGFQEMYQSKESLMTLKTMKQQGINRAFYRYSRPWRSRGATR